MLFIKSPKQSLETYCFWSVLIMSPDRQCRVTYCFSSVSLLLWHPQRSWGDVLLFYVSFFSYFYYSSTHFVHRVSKNWVIQYCWNYNIMRTPIWSCAPCHGMVKDGRRFHGNNTNAKKIRVVQTGRNSTGMLTGMCWFPVWLWNFQNGCRYHGNS